MTQIESIGTEIDDVITRALSDDRIVGSVVLIARDGELVYQRAAGLADRESRKDMRVDALFSLSSVTKAIVCAAAMALIERDELSLESRVDRWLPEFRPKLPSGESPEITIRHLLTHTAGLDYRFQQPPDGPYLARMFLTAWISPVCPCRKTFGALPARRSYIGRASRGSIPSPSMCWARSWSELQISRCRRSSRSESRVPSR
jgi:CubicO group peptidase (beta-lactamase class C family)